MASFSVIGRIGVNQATRYGGGPHPFGVDARAIIADRDHHLAALIGRLDENTPLRLFAVGLALLWRLDAVVDSVAHQMQQRAFDLLEDLAINLGFDALDEELDLFMRAQRRTPDSAIEARHQRLQWHQTRLEQPILEIRTEAVLAREGGLRLADQGLHLVAQAQ